jgi:hypothetical protein
VVNDHQMIFVVTPQQTTLYDEIKYSGSPSSFAWVLPIHGPVTVGLSADIVFASLEQSTRPLVTPPALPPCAIPANCPSCDSFGGGGASFGVAADAAAPAVNVIGQAVVGPYDTVQLQSTNANALNAWLTANGFAVPANVQPVVAAYVNEGFDFLAVKLVPGQGIQAMRPISVTSPGAGVTLPLRMVAAGTGAIVGITLWVVSSGRYEPANFPTFTLTPQELVWDWSKSGSNYTSLEQQKEAQLNNAAWHIEDSLDISPYQVENPILRSAATLDYSPAPASDGGAGQTADQVRQNDLSTLFPAGSATVRVTRMRSDLSQAALANDLVLQASPDQSPLSNLYQAAQSLNAPACPSPPVCPCGSSGTTSSGGIGGGPGSGGGVGGGTSGGTGSGGATGGGDGGASSSDTSGHSSFGCATSPSERGGGGIAILAGLLGAAFVGARMRRKP